MNEFRSHLCAPCRYAGCGENRLTRCLHPKSGHPEFKGHVKTNALAFGPDFDFPAAFDQLALDGCDGFQRAGGGE
jgi:hypothetical protein